MNFRRKSTIGFSIGNILLDLFGGVASYGQMAVQSIDQSVSSIRQLDMHFMKASSICIILYV